jgi:CRISPR/Cas system-associated exonuclease Cas4 (RecB family)
MRTIRSSEIGTFMYCQRAWWYDRHGYESDNLAEMAAGSEIHYRHGRAALSAGCLRYLAYALMLAALALAAIYLTRQFL